MHRRAAFTLIELLVTCCILVMVICFIIPDFELFQRKNQFTVLENEIKQSIQFAKMQTLIRHELLVLHSDDWSKGASLSRLPSRELIHEWFWNISGYKITWKGFQSNHELLFSTLTHSALSGHFLICHKKHCNTLTLNRLGKVYMK